MPVFRLCGLYGLPISSIWYTPTGAFATHVFMVVHPPPPPVLADFGCDTLEFEIGSTFSDIFQQLLGPSMSSWGQNTTNFACAVVSPDQDNTSLPKFPKDPGKIMHNLHNLQILLLQTVLQHFGDLCAAIHLPLGMKFHFSTLHLIFEIEISSQYLLPGRAFCKMSFAKFLYGMHNFLHNFATVAANRLANQVAVQELLLLYMSNVRIFVPTVWHDWRVWCVLHLPTPWSGMLAKCDESSLVGHLVSAAMCDSLGRTTRAGSLQSHHPHIHPHHTYTPNYDLLQPTQGSCVNVNTEIPGWGEVLTHLLVVLTQQVFTQGLWCSHRKSGVHTVFCSTSQ